MLELVKLALAAALEALPSSALFGIITVSDTVRFAFLHPMCSQHLGSTCLRVRVVCSLRHRGSSLLYIVNYTSPACILQDYSAS